MPRSPGSAANLRLVDVAVPGPGRTRELTVVEVVNDNLEKAKARVAEVEGKLEALRGG